MKLVDMIAALSPKLGVSLADDLVTQFLKIRQDLATSTLERAVCGKFVETFVQCLQQLEAGKYESKPDVDKYLVSVESKTALDEGLRLCGSRVARSIYTLRNKRNIAHNTATLDPNSIDLRYTYHACSWILAELLRTVAGLSMEEAGRYVSLLSVPVGTLVEDFGTSKLVLADVSIAEELLILLHSVYPAPLAPAAVYESLSRRSGSAVRNAMAGLVKRKLVHRAQDKSFHLTQLGYSKAGEVINSLTR